MGKYASHVALLVFGRFEVTMEEQWQHQHHLTSVYSSLRLAQNKQTTWVRHLFVIRWNQSNYCKRFMRHFDWHLQGLQINYDRESLCQLGLIHGDWQAWQLAATKHNPTFPNDKWPILWKVVHPAPLVFRCKSSWMVAGCSIDRKPRVWSKTMPSPIPLALPLICLFPDWLPFHTH